MTPHCPLLELCGGCEIRPVNFIDKARQLFPHVEISLNSSPRDLTYRQRLLLRVRIEDGLAKYGFFRSGSHQEFVSIENCAVSSKPIQYFLSWLNRRRKTRFVDCRFRLNLDTTFDDRLHILITPADKDAKYQTDSISNFVSQCEIVEWAGYDQSSAPYFIFEERNGLSYHSKAGLFQQINKDINSEIRSQIVSELSSRATIADLFCGSGNFSLELAHRGVEVHGFDGNTTAVETARHNLAVNNISNAVFTNALDRKSLSGCDAAIIDPPRSGAGELLHDLPLPRKLVYISCSLENARVDLDILQNRGFEIQKLDLYEMFPRTKHCEIVFVVNRQKP